MELVIKAAGLNPSQSCNALAEKFRLVSLSLRHITTKKPKAPANSNAFGPVAVTNLPCAVMFQMVKNALH
jgi:hypothetical protein